MPVPPAPHRKTLRRFHRPGDLHELTFSTFRRACVLVGDDRLRKLSRCIDEAAAETSIQLVAFVYMPDHLHLLTFPTVPEPDIAGYLARFKRRFSSLVKEELRLANSPLLTELRVRERPEIYCFRLWQEGAGYDRNLYTGGAVENSIHYLHGNPVRKRYCEKPTDWKWSSARFYARTSADWKDPDLPTLAGLPADWKGYELKGQEYHRK